MVYITVYKLRITLLVDNVGISNIIKAMSHRQANPYCLVTFVADVENWSTNQWTY